MNIRVTDYIRASADLRRYLPMKIVIAGWLVLCLGVYIYAVGATWNAWWPYGVVAVNDLESAKPAIYAFLGGGIGSTVYVVRGFYWATGPQRNDEPRYQFDPNFVWWYAFRPLIGGFLGATVYALLRGGIGSFGASSDSGRGGSAAYFGVAFLAGFALHELLGWVTELGRRAFRVSGPPTSRPEDARRAARRTESNDDAS